ncbi:MAG: sugar ABC transporter substrate-binding protein [Synergistaceae bacterium]|nr:sugar ABC transporter substrate-binding protein [Synergistaceae bacterium]
MKKSRFFCIFVLAMMFFSCAATVFAGEEVKISGRTIGVSLMDMRQQYFIAMVEGMKAAAEKYELKLNVQDQENDSARQTTQLENFISMGVDGMIICAIDGDVADTQVAAAATKGILTIAEGIDIKSARVWQNWIEFDYGYTVGKMAGKWISKNLPDEEIVECGVLGQSYTPQLKDRTDGIVAGLTENAPNAKVVAIQDSESMQRAIEITENWMQEHPNMRVICGIDDDNGGIGANEALNAIIPPEKRDKYAVFGADGVAEAIKRIKEGGCYKGTVDIDPYGQGYNCVEVLVRLWKGEDVERFILVQSDKEVDYETAIANY